MNLGLKHNLVVHHIKFPIYKYPTETRRSITFHHLLFTFNLKFPKFTKTSYLLYPCVLFTVVVELIVQCRVPVEPVQNSVYQSLYLFCNNVTFLFLQTAGVLRSLIPAQMNTAAGT